MPDINYHSWHRLIICNIMIQYYEVEQIAINEYRAITITGWHWLGMAERAHRFAEDGSENTFFVSIWQNSTHKSGICDAPVDECLNVANNFAPLAVPFGFQLVVCIACLMCCSLLGPFVLIAKL